MRTRLWFGAMRVAVTDDQASGPHPEALRFAPNDWIPNNPHLPVLVYRGAVPISGSDPAGHFEQRLASNGWPPQWRDGVYPFHHFHPATHEVLGFARGHARVILGGAPPIGREIEVNAGDVVVLPAGTGHCKIEASDDFLVVGAYPPNQDTSISREALSNEEHEAMLRVAFPASDPLAGQSGPLVRLWKR
ncbi:cupin [Trinickia sp. LjRoot230]|uniref:cupin n=1 Tax=Trinickia sp. LjRoot230 TaxID=3342288 RepID=UPI003ECC6B1C